MPATPAWPPRSAPRLFVTRTLALDTELALDGNQAHYLLRVMRIKTGDIVILCDNITGEWASRVVSAGKRDIRVAVIEHLRLRETVPDFTLCPALIRKDRFDLVLEKATELGAARIQPVLTRRCVVDRLNPDRARTIVTEAAEQCARTALPEVMEPVKLDMLLRQWEPERTLLFADEMADSAGADEAVTARFSASLPPAGLLVGPEGGFDDAERAAIRAHACAHPVSLGPRILRAETAAIAAMAVWMAQAGDWTDRLNQKPA